MPVDARYFEDYLERQEKRDMKKSAKQEKIAKVMREYKSGTLHSGKDPKGPKKAKVVKSRKQAIAIALSQAGMSKKGNK